MNSATAQALQSRTWNRVSRAEAQINKEAPYRQLAAVSADPLAFRWYILRREGAQTLHNCIVGDHGLPNRY